MAQLQNIMRDFTLFIDGVLYSGDVETVTTPKLTYKTEEYRGGGMDVTVDIPLGMEKIELEFDLTSHDPGAYGVFGLVQGSTAIFKVMGHLISHGGGETGAEIDCTGFIREIAPGEWRPGGKTATKFMVNCDYYKHTIGGVPILEIDALNKVFMVNGVDRNANARQYLGIS